MGLCQAAMQTSMRPPRPFLGVNRTHRRHRGNDAIVPFRTLLIVIDAELESHLYSLPDARLIYRARRLEGTHATTRVHHRFWGAAATWPLGAPAEADAPNWLH